MEKLIISSEDELKNIITEAVNAALANQLKTPSAQSDVKGEYLTRKEAAKALKMSIPTLDRHTKSGAIPSYLIGNRILFKRTELEVLPASRRFK